MVATYTRLDSITLLNSRPTQYILLQQNKPLKTHFFKLPPNVYPVFLDRSKIMLLQEDISRLQLLIRLGLALKKYKVQNATFDSAVVDLKCYSEEGTAIYKRFYSTYVQLS